MGLGLAIRSRLRVRRWGPVPLLLALALTVLAGCGYLPEESDGSYTIHLTQDNKFAPDSGRVPAGATVRFVIDGGFHDVSVHVDDGPALRSSKDPTAEGGAGKVTIGPGESWTTTFPDKGDFLIWCHTHHEEGMMMELKVK